MPCEWVTEDVHSAMIDPPASWCRVTRCEDPAEECPEDECCWSCGCSCYVQCAGDCMESIPARTAARNPLCAECAADREPREPERPDPADRDDC